MWSLPASCRCAWTPHGERLSGCWAFSRCGWSGVEVQWQACSARHLDPTQQLEAGEIKPGIRMKPSLTHTNSLHCGSARCQSCAAPHEPQGPSHPGCCRRLQMRRRLMHGRSARPAM